MAILQKAEIWFAKLNPQRPNARYNKDNPTWEIQLRTRDKEQRKIWEELKLPVKAVVPDEGAPYWKVNLRRKSKNREGKPNDPVEVVNGNLDSIDPNTIGNGSIGNIRIFQYQYGEEKKTATVLMKIQLIKHVVYQHKGGDDFEMTDTETIDGSHDDAGDDAGDDARY